MHRKGGREGGTGFVTAGMAGAAEVLMLIGEIGGDLLMSRIGMMRALHHRPEAAATPRRKRVKSFRIVK